MKISEKWLREFVPTKLSREDISHRLTMLGLEVDSVLPVSSIDLRGVILGKVVEFDPHHSIKNLKICKVDIGDDYPKTVICGAPEIRQGSLVPYAPAGLTLGKRQIKKRDFDGVMSDGMLCSKEDLGLEEKSEGLFTFPVDSVTEGQSLEETLDLPDFVFDIDLTPNRGDCFSVLGVSRELSAVTNEVLRSSTPKSYVADVEDTMAIDIQWPERCPIYAGRVIRDIRNLVDTPTYISERLLRSGIRPINSVVDITNYVMLEIGQPMHAFDYEKLKDGILVRESTEREQLELLDGRIIDLTPEVLVIADHEKPIALAGVMGGAYTGVTNNTNHIFLESAFFEPIALAGIARKYGLQTDASMRFERGVDPNLYEIAIERATNLICDICGGRAGPIVIAGSPKRIKRNKSITFRPDMVNKRLGTHLPERAMLDALESIRFSITREKRDEWEVRVPSFRFDINLEVDLVEEVARLIGYDKIPTELPKIDAQPRLYPEEQRIKDVLRQGFVWRSFTEVVTYSFVSEDKGNLFGAEEVVRLDNPITSEMEVMRPNILCSLVYPLLHNVNRQKNELRLFEIGKVFKKDGDVIVEELHAACLRFGPLFEKQWGLKLKSGDFFDIKGDMNTILSSVFETELELNPCCINGLHPGQSASVCSGGEQIGLVGAMHPSLVSDLDLSGSVVFFEVNLDALEPCNVKTFEPVSKFPSVTRDISIVVSEGVSAQNCLSIVGNLNIPILRDLQLFDLYRGQGIDSLKKSFSIGLIFQSPSGTLTDDEVDRVVDIILKSLKKEVGAVLRN